MIDTKTLLEEVKANIAFLDGCDVPHDFIPHEKYCPDGDLYRNYKCSKCGGVLATIEVHWYERGLEHANL